MKTNLMHYLSSVYFVNQPLHVSDIFVAHHQEVYCVYIEQLVRVVLFSWLSVGRVRMELLYIYSTPPDDVLQICPKHVEVDWWNKLRLNSAPSWFSLQGHLHRLFRKGLSPSLTDYWNKNFPNYYSTKPLEDKLNSYSLFLYDLRVF
jgi:hypothetical protein